VLVRWYSSLWVIFTPFHQRLRERSMERSACQGACCLSQPSPGATGSAAGACAGAAAGGAAADGPRPDGPAPDGPTPASCGCGRAGGARRRRLSALL
jgi:hypothetical protein